MLTIGKMFDLPRTKGEIGMEIEVEGLELPREVEGFIKEHDGSLRGEAAEYVFCGPVSREETEERLKRLFAAYEEAGSVILQSYRCSAHVHVNAQDMTMREITCMVLLYVMFEEYLVKFCGEHREGNMFCLRVKDAEAHLQAFIEVQETEDFGLLAGDELRYAAINFNALSKYGSLEFRSMRGTDNIDDLLTWVDLLRCLKAAAISYDDPCAIIEDISRIGPFQLAEKVFGDLLQKLPFDGDWEKVVFSNMQDTQQLAYCREWVE